MTTPYFDSGVIAEGVGMANGLAIGRREGYENGKRDGYRNGYDIGHTDGWTAAVAKANPIIVQQIAWTKEETAAKNAALQYTDELRVYGENVKALNARLNASLQAERERILALEKRVAELSSSNEALVETNAALTDTVGSLKAMNERITQRAELAEKRYNDRTDQYNKVEE